MTTYTVLAGDTFDLVARKQYGTEQEAGRIATANPGVVEPLTPGTSLSIPVLPGAPQDVVQQATAKASDETAILIEGQRFRFWDKIRITRSIDAMSTVEFGAPFDAEVRGFKATFRPFAYKPIVVTVGGAPIFTGTMLNVDPVIDATKKIIAVSAYSTPGVLNDCTPPASQQALEFDGMGLRDIATALAAPFGISVVFDAEQGPVFERVAIAPGKKVLSFLVELAKQRNLIVSANAAGALVFLQSIAGGQPVAVLGQGQSPLLSVTPNFKPQEFHSDITGIEDALVGLPGSQFTVKNTFLPGVVRPLTFKAPDMLGADIKAAVQAKAARMYANVVSYVIEVASWRDPNGELWAPNTSLKLVAPDAMIYNEYEFIIRSVSFSRDAKAETATLNLVLPGAFRGVLPEALPWDA